MFGWFKKRQRQELIKLLYQNQAAYTEIATVRQYQKLSTARTFDSIEAENRRIALLADSNSTLPATDLQWLLDTNRELRRLFDEVEANGPEARVRAAFGQPMTKRNFDETFIPTGGWKEYYKWMWQ